MPRDLLLMSSWHFSLLPDAPAWCRFPTPLLHLTALRKLSVVLGSPPLDAPELDDEEPYVEPEVPYEDCAPKLPPGIPRLVHLQELHVPHFKVPHLDLHCAHHLIKGQQPPTIVFTIEPRLGRLDPVCHAWNASWQYTAANLWSLVPRAKQNAQLLHICAPVYPYRAQRAARISCMYAPSRGSVKHTMYHSRIFAMQLTVKRGLRAPPYHATLFTNAIICKCSTLGPCMRAGHGLPPADGRLLICRSDLVYSASKERM